MADSRLVREDLITFIADAQGFKAFYYSVLAPMMNDWREELQHNTSLTETEMRARQYALAAIEDGLTRALDKSKIHLPDWLNQELHPYERTE